MIGALALGVVGVVAWWVDRQFRRQERQRLYGPSTAEAATRRQWIKDHRVRTADDEFWDDEP